MHFFFDGVDPYYAWLRRASSGGSYSEAELIPDQLTFFLSLSFSAAGQTLPLVQLRNCTMYALDNLNSEGTALFAQLQISVPPSSNVPCNPVEFAGTSNDFVTTRASSSDGGKQRCICAGKTWPRHSRKTQATGCHAWSCTASSPPR